VWIDDGIEVEVHLARELRLEILNLHMSSSRVASLAQQRPGAPGRC
jgi:hypothetical protein